MMQASLSLPATDADSTAHSRRVADAIGQRIDAAGGSISFGDYMQQALYAPGLGYYTAGNRKFGADGDFVTAPELSPLFGRVVARQCVAVLDALGGGDVLELGAGSGRMAADMLRLMADLDRLPASYSILEVSPELTERQRDYLADAIPAHAARVRWLDRLPTDFRGVIVANEVLDALPVERFVRRESGAGELRVVRDGDGFAASTAPASPALEAALAELEASLDAPLPVGYRSEICLALPDFVAGLATSLAAGAVLLLDYGLERRSYYAADRSGGWLRCHFRHRVHDDPFVLPGVQDITAWVDFTAVATALADAGLDIGGYVTQAQFMLGGGLAEELADIAERPPDEQAELSGQVKLLTLPGEMGEHFKCVFATRDVDCRPAAFAAGDRTHRL